MPDGIPAWLQVAYLVLSIPSLGMLFASIQARQKRKAAAPREEAETDDVIVARVTKENERLSDRLEAQDEKIEKLAAAGDRYAERLNMLERKQRSAVQFIGYLITQWPQTVPIPVIPDDLAEDVAPHIRRPKWAAAERPPDEAPTP